MQSLFLNWIFIVALAGPAALVIYFLWRIASHTFREGTAGTRVNLLILGVLVVGLAMYALYQVSLNRSSAPEPEPGIDRLAIPIHPLPQE